MAPNQMDVCRSRTVDRNLRRPIWLQSPDTKLDVTRKDSKQYKSTPKLLDKELKATNLKEVSSDWMHFPAIKDKMPMTTEVRQEFERHNLSIRPGFRRLARRRDQIQIAPREVRSESRSNYQRNFEGTQNPEVVKAIVPVDEGLNGLETDVQLEARKDRKLHGSTKNRKRNCAKHPCSSDLITTKNIFMKDSVYRKDFREPFELFESGQTGTNSSNIPEKPLDMSTNYRSSYHSWVNYEDPESFTFCNWKPALSVYITPDPEKTEKMDFRTSYGEDFRGIVKDRVQPKRLSTSIDKFKLLNAVNGEPQAIPLSLYQDTYVPMTNVDNWSYRNIHQNLKALSKQVGPSHDDDTYWKDVDREPYQHYKKAVFSRSCKKNDISVQS